MLYNCLLRIHLILKEHDMAWQSSDVLCTSALQVTLMSGKASLCSAPEAWRVCVFHACAGSQGAERGLPEAGLLGMNRE